MVEFTYDGSYEAILADNPWIVGKKMASEPSRDLGGPYEMLDKQLELIGEKDFESDSVNRNHA